LQNTTSLPRVDFYHLANDQEHRRRLFCCRLAEKAWKLGNRIFVLCDDDKFCHLLDELMWTYRDDGFLPHALADTADATADTPILLGERLPADEHFDLVISMFEQVPAQIAQISSQTDRIAEIINQDPNRKQQGRIRYSYYDKNKYPLEYHEITAG
jgi:DNA polymerase-3 subunit chi